MAEGVGNGNHIAPAKAPGAVHTFPCAKPAVVRGGRLRGSAPRGEGAERGRWGLKVERVLGWAAFAIKLKAGRSPLSPLSSGILLCPSPLPDRQEKLTLEFH